MDNTRNDFNRYLVEPYTGDNHYLVFRLMSEKVEDPPVSCFDKITNWWFPIVNDNDKDTNRWSPCCSSNLELSFPKICCTEDTVFYCICFSVAFL